MNNLWIKSMLAGSLWALVHTSQAQSNLHFDSNSEVSGLNPGIANWGVSDAIWNTSQNPPALSSGVSWIPGSIAVFQSSGANVLTLDGSFTLGGIHQLYPTTSTSILGAGTLTLNGGNNTLYIGSESTFTFGNGVTLQLSQLNASTALDWNTNANAETVVNGVVTGELGNTATLTGGWRIGGLGITRLNGENTYSGLTRLSGQVVMGHRNALTSSNKLLLENGGSLTWGAGLDWSPTAYDLSSKLEIANSARFTFDTNGNNIHFSTALKGINVEYVKRGAGTLTLTHGSTFTGKLVIEQGMVKNGSAADLQSNTFGAGGNIIEIKSGATLDINYGSAFNYNATSKQYVVYAEGKGVADPTTNVFGGHLGAITHSSSNGTTSAPFSEIILTGDTTLSGRSGTSGRWGFNKINANNHTITIVNGGGLSWGVAGTNATNVRDIIIEQGRLWADGTSFGDDAYSIYVNANTHNGATIYGEFGGWNGGKVITKKVVINGGMIVTEGNTGSSVINTITYTNYGVGAGLDNFMSFDLNGQVTLNRNTVQNVPNEFRSNISVKDIKVKGVMTGEGGFLWNGSVADVRHTPANGTVYDTANTVLMSRMATMFVTNSGNNFTGDVSIFRGLLRMSDGSGAGGKLGAGSNTLLFTGVNETAALDLFGTSQSLGGINGSGTKHYIQNNRSNTTSMLTVGTGNAGGNFAGVLRDYAALYSHQGTLTNEGVTGAVLALTKTGTGKQIFSGISTFTGGTIVAQGHLQVGSTTATSSTAQLGLGALTVQSGATLSGNGRIGAGAHQILINTGATLKVGIDGNTTAQTLAIHSTFRNQGLVQFDLLGYTAGNGNNTHSDFLTIAANALMDFDGTLALNNASGSDSSTWTSGSWFRLIDWGTTDQGNRDTTGWALGSMPTLASGLEWKMDQLMSTGRIYIGAVPEPTQTVLAFLGMSFLIFRRYRNP